MEAFSEGGQGPQWGCSAIDGNGSSLESLTKFFRQLNLDVNELR